MEKRVEAALKTEDAKLKTSWSSTLFDIGGLPFKLADLPSTHGTLEHSWRQLLVIGPHVSENALP